MSAPRKLPNQLKPLFWFTDPERLDLNKNKVDIIHQVLALGSLEDIKLLFSLYPREEIRRVFLKTPRNIYTPKGFDFIKNFILKEKKLLSFNRYAKNILGPVARPWKKKNA